MDVTSKSAELLALCMSREHVKTDALQLVVTRVVSATYDTYGVFLSFVHIRAKQTW